MSEQTLTRPAERLRTAAMPVWRRILEHPYLRELKAGTLPEETFRFYVQQDWLYLQEFTRAAAIIAGRCPDPAVMKFLLGWVQPLVDMEYHFHKKHAAQLGLDFDNITWTMNEANWAYTRHMLAAAHAGSTAEALAALLPCPCVYTYVGQKLSDGPRSPNPMYAEWIDFYRPGPEGYRPRVAALEELYDRLAASADAATLARCEQNYIISSRYEWWFWDTAYRRQMWPV
ncbi:MAG TPA: thiaminase II [Chloroflexota bacterium]|nr:thiaminase II [Chloroflexota bacterium]